MALRYAILPHPPASGAPSRREPLRKVLPYYLVSTKNLRLVCREIQIALQFALRVSTTVSHK